MADTTKNMHLVKEHADDFYNVETVNYNLDLIDEAMTETGNHVSQAEENLGTLQSQVGDLNDLDTSDQSNLVKAMNETQAVAMGAKTQALETRNMLKGSKDYDLKKYEGNLFQVATCESSEGWASHGWHTDVGTYSVDETHVFTGKGASRLTFELAQNFPGIHLEKAMNLTQFNNHQPIGDEDFLVFQLVIDPDSYLALNNRELGLLFSNDAVGTYTNGYSVSFKPTNFQVKDNQYFIKLKRGDFVREENGDWETIKGLAFYVNGQVSGQGDITIDHMQFVKKDPIADYPNPCQLDGKTEINLEETQLSIFREYGLLKMRDLSPETRRIPLDLDLKDLYMTSSARMRASDKVVFPLGLVGESGDTISLVAEEGRWGIKEVNLEGQIKTVWSPRTFEFSKETHLSCTLHREKQVISAEFYMNHVLADEVVLVTSLGQLSPCLNLSDQALDILSASVTQVGRVNYAEHASTANVSKDGDFANHTQRVRISAHVNLETQGLLTYEAGMKTSFVCDNAGTIEKMSFDGREPVPIRTKYDEPLLDVDKNDVIEVIYSQGQPDFFLCAPKGGAKVEALIKDYVIAAGQNIKAGDLVEFVNEKVVKAEPKWHGENFKASVKKVFNQGNTYYISATQMSEDRVLVVYRDGSNSNYGTAIVIGLEGLTVTLGSPVVFNDAGTIHNDLVRLNEERVVVTYRDQGNRNGSSDNYNGKAQVLTIEGLKVTSGQAVVFNSGSTNYISAVGLDEERLVVTYRDDSNSYYGTAVILTVSGQTLSVGSKVVFNSGDCYYMSAVGLDEERLVVTYSDYSNSYYGTAVILTVSGQTISVGGKVVFNSGSTYYMSAVGLDEERLVVAYQDSSNSHYGTAVILTVSGQTLRVGSEVVFNAKDSSSNDMRTYYISLSPLSHDQVMVCYENGQYNGSSWSHTGESRVLKVVGTSMTCGQPHIFNPAYGNSQTTSYIQTLGLSIGKALVLYQDYANGYNYYGTGKFLYAENTAKGLALQKGVGGETKKFYDWRIYR